MKYLYTMALILFIACGQNKNATEKSENPISNSDTISKNSENINNVSDKNVKKIKFLWLEEKYNEELKGDYNTIVINEDYVKTITEPEKAALAYVATFIGNECNWDGAFKDDRSNLKCKILDTLNLGYQCSDQHLGFLRKMFKNDTEVLEKLKDCPTIPETSTSQDMVTEITLSVEENEITVTYKGTNLNMRDGKEMGWTKIDNFEYNKNDIKLISQALKKS